MINASELRIGNWVNVSTPHPYYGGGFKQVDEINEYGIGRTNGDSTMHDFEELSGIPLSPDLLERSGFVKDGDQWHKQYREGRRAFSLTYDGEVFTYQVSHAETLTVWDLHQLMNLFYALTGEELKITL